MNKVLRCFLFCLLVAVPAACENTSRDADSEVDSQIGDDETRLILQAQSIYSGVGVLSPRGCTGWFVAKNFFITNQHCVSSIKTLLPESDTQQFDAGYCSGMTIAVNHYTDGQRYDAATIYKCKKIHMANQSHDFAVVEIEGEAKIQPLALAPVATAGMEIVVIGHPNGNAKTISEYEGSMYCRLRDVSFPDGKTARDAPEPRYGPRYEHSIEHNCDTLGGSSGSPIIDRATGAVVALHWDGWVSSAWPHADPNGAETANVMIVDPDNPGQLIPFSFKHRQGNVGIRIQNIRNFVRNAALNDPGLAEVAAIFN